MADDPSVQLIKMGVAWAVIIATLFFLGVTITPSFAVAFAFVLIAVAVVAQQSRDISIPFTLSFIIVLALLAEFILPKWFMDAVPDIGAFVGIPFAELDAVNLAVSGTLAILAIWILQIRLTGRAVKPTTITKRVRRNAEGLVDDYVTIGRLTVGFFVAVGFMIASQSGMLAGEFGSWFAEVPFVTGSVAIGLGGWLSLGGTLPYVGNIPLLGTMTQGEFLAFVLIILGLAAAVKYND